MNITKISRKLVSVLLTFILVVCTIPSFAYGDKQNFAKLEVNFSTVAGTKSSGAGTVSIQNSLTENEKMQLEAKSVNSNLYKNTTTAYKYLQSQMGERNKDITFSFYCDDEPSIVVGNLFYEAVSEDNATKSNYGDYLLWSISKFKISLKYSSSTDSYGEYLVTVQYIVDYYSNANEENDVKNAVSKALKSLSVNKSSDYEKLWKIYNYVIDTVDYTEVGDYSSSNERMMYTAYGAICKGSAVCQGYSLLLYRMLKEVGISSRFIYSNDHGWNIVQIDGDYYEVDATWDDGTKSGYNYPYFMKTTKEFDSFESHKRTGNNFTRVENPYTELPVANKKYDYKNNIGTYSSTKVVAVQSYTGKEIRPTLAFDSKVIKSDDYNLTYENNVDYGTGVVTATATEGKYFGYVTREFTISCATHKIKTTTTKATKSANGKIVKTCTTCGETISTTAIPKIKTISISAKSYTYNGKVRKPTVTIKDSKGNKIPNNTYATIKYSNSNSKKIGKYTVKVTLKGNYSGSETLTYNITPKKVSIKSVSPSVRAFTVKWSTTSTATGYQIQYATKSNFSNAETKTIKGYKNKSKKITHLKGSKKYYVRIRTYKTVGKNKYYSPWSSTSTVKTKK